MKIQFDATQLKIDQAIEELKRRMQTGVLNAGLRVESTAKRLAPKDTGMLRSTIQFDFDENANEGVVTGHVGAGGGNVNYAIWVHEGTGVHSRTGMGRKDPWGYVDEEATAKAREKDPDADPVVVWTDGNEPQPFLENAYKEEHDSVRKIIARAVKGET